MKTQLLEDIGQSAELSLPPALTAGPPKAGKAWSPQRRATGGVWRQKPAVESPALAAQEPAVTPALELREVFDEIAALEAQFVDPVAQPRPGPAGAPIEPPRPPSAALAESPPDAPVPPAETTLARDPTATIPAPHDPLFDFTLPLRTSPAEPQHEPVVRSAGEAMLDWTPAPAATAGRDSLFDFTPPTTPLPAVDPFTPAGSGRKRSLRPYVLWAGCLVAAGLLFLGGRWLYQERADAGSLALVTDQAKRMEPVGQAAARQAVAQSAPAPDAGAHAAPATAASRPSPAVPPLVMLKPEEYSPRKDAQPSSAPKEMDAAPPNAEPKPKLEPRPEPKSKPKPEPKLKPKLKPKPEPAAQQRPAPPVPKAAIRKTQSPPRTVADSAQEKRKREPVRQVARAPAVAPERPAEADTSMETLLKACRAHGYHAAQCIKRGCSVSQYGFACRGR